jgi:hypothetical protein
MSSHRSANGTATDDSPDPSHVRTREAKISSVWRIEYVSSSTIASPGLDTRCPLRRTSEASARRLESTATATQRHPVMIENIDDRWDVVVLPDV